MLVGMHTYNHLNNNLVYCAAWAFPAGYNGADEMRKWCRDTYGDPAPDAFPYEDWLTSQYKWRDYIIWGEIEFLDEKNLNWFLMRWK